MNKLIPHIEFLLHKHNCVIVPNLGGFVVNTIPASKEALSNFCAPISELVFNRDLTYNDGLLIESFMRVEKISSEVAQQKIKKAVKEIKEILHDKKEVSLGDLGNLEMIDEERFGYISKPFIRPEHYGMTLASLKPIIQLQPKTTQSSTQIEKGKNKNNNINWKNTEIGIAAAVIIAFILLIFPIQDTALHHQTAQIVSESGLFSNKIKKTKTEAEIPNLTDISTNNEIDLTAETVLEITNLSNEESHNPYIDNSNSTSVQIEDINTIKYYIVAGVYKVKEYADNMTTQLKKEGYTNTSTIEKSERTIVFTESFTSINEAQIALNKLIQQNQYYQDAWILKQ